jgi:hypothetical protein
MYKPALIPMIIAVPSILHVLSERKNPHVRQSPIHLRRPLLQRRQEYIAIAMAMPHIITALSMPPALKPFNMPISRNIDCIAASATKR